VLTKGGTMPSVLENAIRDWPDGAELQYVPMSLQEYLDLPQSTSWGDCPKVEWSKGVAIMIRPLPRHGLAQSALTHQLLLAVPDALVLPELVLQMGDDYRVPDLMILSEVDPDVEFYTGVPLVVIEIVSPSTWRNDLLDKSDEYAQWGIPQYWIVDPEVGEIVIRANENGQWRTTSRLTAETPAIDVALGKLGVATLRRSEIFRYLAK